MTWIAPAAERTNPPPLADERAGLDSWLDFQRATLLHKGTGLTGQRLAARPVASSQLSLLGLVRHMAATERIWFRIRFARPDVEDLYESPDYPDSHMIGEYAVDGILFLESSPYITGEILHIDGGQIAGH